MGVILCYHHVLKTARDANTVTVKKFAKDMALLRGKQVVYLDDYDPINPNQVVISFDDGYRDLLLNALPILKKYGYPFELFLLKKYLDLGNGGNLGFLSAADINVLVENGGRVQYHTKNHPNLANVTDVALLEEEIKAPEELKQLDPKGFGWFAYPYFAHNTQVMALVKKYYRGACAGREYGDDTNRYALMRIKVEKAAKKKKRDGWLAKFGRACRLWWRLKTHKEIKADFYISLGMACSVAYWLRRFELRRCANPLDWMMDYQLQTVIDLIKSGFDGFFANREIDLSRCNQNFNAMRDTKTGMISMHSFKKDVPDEVAFEAFTTIMKRRFVRMDDFIKKSKRIVFVCARQDSIDAFKSFLGQFNKIYEGKNLILINVRNSKQEAKHVYRLSSKIKILDFSFDDNHEGGKNKALNPMFWIGNETKWCALMKKLHLSDVLSRYDVSQEDSEQR